jgi:hypothetical protein
MAACARRIQAAGHVIDSLVLRAAIGLPVACMAMDEDAAAP